MPKLLLFLLILLFCSGAALAQTEAAAAAAAKQHEQRFARGLFWSISKGGEHIGYLFGTLHSNDVRVATLKKPVRSALLEADNFCVETFPGVRYFSPNSGFKSIVSDMMLEEGQRLDELVDAKTYRLVRARLLKNGFNEERIARLKPWAAMHAISGLYRERDAKAKDEPSTNGSSLMLDHLLYHTALDNSATVYELETLEELMAAYYAFPMAAQIALLKDRAEHLDELTAVAEAMVESYLQEDLVRMLSLATRFISQSSLDKGYKATYLKHVLYIRNIVMAHYMLAPLRRKNTFIAVGALHLYGEKGVLSLLEGYGYEVKRLSLI